MADSALYLWPAGQAVTNQELNQTPAALSGQADVGAIQLASPTANPGAITATVLSEAGNLNGAYQWVMTETVGLVDGNGNLHPGGQTGMGTPSNLVNPSNNPVALTVPAPSARSVSRTIWRTQAGGTTFYFLVTLTNPQVSTWIDDVADADLGTETAPTVNNTGTVLSLPVFDSVPTFSVEAGTLIAVTNADNATTLYRSDGSGWLALPDLAVANTWTALQTLSSGIAVPSGAVFTNSGTYAGTPLVTGLTAATGISVTNPTSPGAATVAVSNAPNSALAGPLVTGLTAGTGLSVTNPTSPGAATVDVVLSGTTLTNSSGLAINLANTNTWTGSQTLESATLTGTTTNAGAISGGTINPASGTVAGDWTVHGFVSANNYSLYSGNFNGSVSGNSFTTTSFGSNPGGFGLGWNANQDSGDTDLFAFSTSAANSAGRFRFFANVSPSSPTTVQQIGTWDAAGNLSVTGLITANSNLALPSTTPDTAAGVISQSGNQLYIGNGSTANGVSTSAAGTWTPASGTFNVASGTVINVASVPVGAVNFKVIVGEGTTDANYIIGVTTTSGSAWVTAASDSSPLTGASAAISSTTTTNSPGGVWYDGSYSATGYFQINTGYLQLVVISSAASAVAVAPLNWGVS